MQLVSVDIETTGLDPMRHQVLSVGMVNVLNIKDTFYRTIKHPEYTVTPKALQVNGINLATWEGCSPAEAAADMYSWLVSRHEKEWMALGFNVGTFDLQFLKRMFEQAKIPYIFHYRSIDLNSCMELKGVRKSDIDGELLLHEYLKQNPSNVELKAHHALADAMINVLVWYALRK